MRLTPPELRILDEPTCERIHTTALQILRQKGFRVASARLRQMLAKAGAEVDDRREIVTLSEVLVSEALASAPDKLDIYDLDGGAVCFCQGSVLDTIGTYVEAVAWLEHGADRLRPATLADLRNALKLADALPLVQKAGVIVTPLDLPVQAQTRQALLAILTTTRKSLSFGIQNEEQARLIFDALSVGAPGLDLSKQPVGTFACSPTSPLLIDEDTGDTLVFTLGRGLVPVLAPCPMAGATSQFSVIGTVLQQVVENLFMVAAKFAVDSSAPLLWGGAAGPMDMRAGDVSYGAIERSLMMLANIDMARHFGLPCHSPAASVDSCLIDAQLGAEKTWTYLTRVLSRAATGMAVGAVTNGKAVSLEQMVIDVDLINCAKRLAEGIEADHMEAAAQEILDVGHGGDFMTADSTLELLREANEYYYPATFNRSGTSAAPMLDRAHEEARRILAEWECPVPESICCELARLLTE